MLRSRRRCAEIDAEGYRSVAVLSDRAGRTIRILGNGVNVVQSSDYPDIDERVQRAIIAVSRASTPAPMDRCEWTPTFDVHSPDPLHRNPIIGESSRSGRVLDDCPESAQPRARTVWVYCGDLGEAP